MTGAVFLAGCQDGFFVEPAAAPTRVTFSFAGASLASAFDKADRAHVTVHVAGTAPIEKDFEFPPGQPEIRLQVEITVGAPESQATVEVELFSGSGLLFRGDEVVTVKEGQQNQVEISPEPVAAQLVVQPVVQITTLNAPQQLNAVVLFATGDTLPASVQWAPVSNADVSITAGGVVTAQQNGTFNTTASFGNLTQPVQVNVASPAATITFISGQGQSAFPGDTVPVAPSVVVRNAQGIALRGVTVTFVPSNGGSVNATTVTTNSSGVAALSRWTLGDHGVNVLAASAPGVPTVSLQATTIDPCTRSVPTLALPVTINGQITARRDCRVGNRHVDRFQVNIAPQTVVRGTITAASFANPVILASRGPNTNRFNGYSGTPPVPMEYIVPAGQYWWGAAANDTLTSGSYTLALQTIAEPQVGCTNEAYTLPGGSANANITDNDCPDTVQPAFNRKSDGYVIQLRTGESWSATVSPGVNFPVLVAGWRGDVFIQSITVSGGQTGTLTLTETGSGAFWSIYVLNLNTGVYGPYAISFGGNSPVGVSAVTAPELFTSRRR